MKILFIALTAGALFAAALPGEADAARLGGGRSFGAQRSVVTPQKAAPSRQAAQQSGTAAQQPQPAAGNRWLGPLAGLAAGLGLGWLFSQGGFGAIASVLLMALAGIAVYMLLARYARPRGGAQPLRYAAPAPQSGVASPLSQVPGFGSGDAPTTTGRAPRVPAGFDATGFLKQAKLNFVRLQEANDRGDLDTIRDVTTDEMFESLSAELAGGRNAPQRTDVVNLDASLLEVVTEGDVHWASVHFCGTIREDAHGTAKPFEEVWHLRKSVAGGSGWLLAGIQQVSSNQA